MLVCLEVFCFFKVAVDAAGASGQRHLEDGVLEGPTPDLAAIVRPHDYIYDYFLDTSYEEETDY